MKYLMEYRENFILAKYFSYKGTARTKKWRNEPGSCAEKTYIELLNFNAVVQMCLLHYPGLKTKIQKYKVISIENIFNWK